MGKMHLDKIIIVMFLAVFLVSCTQNSSNIVTQQELRQGTDALSMKFLENSPPDKVFSAEQGISGTGTFQVGLELLNKGASDINAGEITLSLESGYINDLGSNWISSNERFSDRYTKNYVTFELEGKKPENPAGGRILFTKLLQANIPASDVQSQTRKSTIIATACYDYKTQVTASVCLDPKPFAEKIGPSPCQVKDATFNSQGAPLAVTKISPRMIAKGSGSTLEVLIYVKNKGVGQIIPSNSISTACAPSGPQTTAEERQKFWNTIDQEDFKIELSAEGQPFKCAPFPLKLTSGEEDFVRCVYEGTITGTQPYTTTLNLEFDYGYTHSISKDLTIERPPKIAP
ncbi:hypothetical protein KY308_04165 [Candidatus Woesearchaeota archaeon]|nr:hypothetical protein [Candidatus Woesearchaeota archaeon]